MSFTHLFSPLERSTVNSLHGLCILILCEVSTVVASPLSTLTEDSHYQAVTMVTISLARFFLLWHHGFESTRLVQPSVVYLLYFGSPPLVSFLYVTICHGYYSSVCGSASSPCSRCYPRKTFTSSPQILARVLSLTSWESAPKSVSSYHIVYLASLT